ncbi:alpha/beta-hydrolase [Basidiobolus meristosporus CBS 931.73]|uniref:Alpha/beta-hydrolase n=1 Tax=Basidiobolus meristosporus CBS 931.73 TaxID=1314790 RepID=A0A1Y1YPI9_9FUNG|nr:alpha/beta-hydrolase [Basidiobolus meristosporus CBS 931.73]|eukprot:ORX99921.1 alpha/beta-hydrolase [Basidiobolus meristosporus CBS 931.73]
MIDHLLGKPSNNLKRVQVILVATAAYSPNTIVGPRYSFMACCTNDNRDGTARYSPWQLILGSLTCVYVVKNAFLLLGLNAPEPLARLYSRNYYRATWILTALDAGFYTAMNIRPKWLMNILSIVFTVFYLVFSERADQKVRRIRAQPTVEYMRMSWEKSLHPLLRFASRLRKPRLTIEKRMLIPRPAKYACGPNPIRAYIYYTGTKESYTHCSRIILNFPGGGFVTMNPECHEDYLTQIAHETGAPVVSIDYGKAPEFPYPYAIEECFDVYRTIVESNGECLGMLGWTSPDGAKRDRVSIAMIGDSAGGNIAASVVLKALERKPAVPLPDGLILIYGCLDFNISSWMSNSQMDLIRAQSAKSLPSLMEAKNHLGHHSPLAVTPDLERKWSTHKHRAIQERIKVPFKLSSNSGTRLSMTSRMSFFNDRIITPNLMRAMAILYVGPNQTPDFQHDYLLSPVVAPDELLAQFPKVYLLCGEKDPLVDDTVIFAGRIREAKRKVWREAKRQRDIDDARDSSMSGFSFRPDRRSNTDLQSFSSKFAMSPATTSNLSTDSASTTDPTKFTPEYLRNSSNPTLRKISSFVNTDFLNDREFVEEKMVEVKILQGISHAFLQMLPIFPEAKGVISGLSEWTKEIFCENSHCGECELRDSDIGYMDTDNSSEEEHHAEQHEGIVMKDKPNKKRQHKSHHRSQSTPTKGSHQKDEGPWNTNNLVKAGELMTRRRNDLSEDLIDNPVVVIANDWAQNEQ